MAALKKYSLLIISYLLILAVVGAVSMFSVGQSMASNAVIVGSDTGISVSPVDASVFNISDMYPGKTETSQVTVRNDGSDPFTLVIDLTSNGDAALLNVLSVKVSTANNVYYNGLLAGAGSIDIGVIAVNENLVLDVAVTMSAEAGNETQNKSFNTIWAFNAVSLVTSLTTADVPFDPFIDIPAEIAAVEPDPAEIVTAVVAEVPAEQTQVTTPEEIQVQPEEPQVVSLVEDIATRYWPLLLLLLLPLLIWFVAGSSVFILVPKENGKYQTVALRLAGRRDKHWFVNVEKPLAKYLESHGKVVVDFRGPMVRDSKTSVYLGNKLLSSSNMRYAVIGKRRLAVWSDNLIQQVNRLVG